MKMIPKKRLLIVALSLTPIFIILGYMPVILLFRQEASWGLFLQFSLAVILAMLTFIIAFIGFNLISPKTAWLWTAIFCGLVWLFGNISQNNSYRYDNLRDMIYWDVIHFYKVMLSVLIPLTISIYLLVKLKCKVRR